MKSPYGYIYKTTFPENAYDRIGIPYYIGLHKSSCFDPKYFGSGKCIQYWFDKSLLSIEILEWAYSRYELGKLEEKYISPLLEKNDPLLLNIIPGGYGGYFKSNQFKEKKRKLYTMGFYKQEFILTFEKAIKKGLEKMDSCSNIHWKEDLNNVGIFINEKPKNDINVGSFSVNKSDIVGNALRGIR